MVLINIPDTLNRFPRVLEVIKPPRALFTEKLEQGKPGDRRRKNTESAQKARGANVIVGDASR